MKGALAGAAGAIGFPTIIPASALGADGATPPSDRITMGAVGVGRMGSGNLRGFLQFDNVHMLAIADVQESRRQRAKNWVDKRNGDTACAVYNDYRELLARKDIDAVCIATGERWHTLVGIEAARQGKHMYCEKPLGRSVEEAKAIREVIRRYGVAFQFGTQQRSSADFRFACDLARNGRIGELQSIAIGSAGGPSSVPLGFDGMPPERPGPVPPGIDWDTWLGPAPWSPYSDLRISIAWLSIYDYALGGIGGEYGIHDIDIAQWANDSDHTLPVSVEGDGDVYRDIRDTLCTYDIEYKYANGVRVNLMDIVTAKKRVPQFQFGESVRGVSTGVTMFGSKGWIWVSRAGMRTHPESLIRTVIGPDENRVMRSDNHKRNFLDAVRTGSPTISPIEVAARDEMMCQMGDIAVRMKRKLRWDPVKEEFLDDELANRKLSRPMRSPWRLEIPGPPAAESERKS